MRLRGSPCVLPHTGEGEAPTSVPCWDMLAGLRASLPPPRLVDSRHSDSVPPAWQPCPFPPAQPQGGTLCLVEPAHSPMPSSGPPLLTPLLLYLHKSQPLGLYLVPGTRGWQPVHHVWGLHCGGGLSVPTSPPLKRH